MLTNFENGINWEIAYVKQHKNCGNSDKYVYFTSLHII